MLTLTWFLLIPFALMIVRWWVGLKDPNFTPVQSVPSAVRLGGALAGMGVALAGVGAAQAGGALTPLVVVADIAFAVAAVVLGLQIADRVFVPGVDNAEAVREGSLPVAMIDAAGALAVGYLAAAVLQGNGGNLATAGVFFLLGLIMISWLPMALFLFLLHVPADRGLSLKQRIELIGLQRNVAVAIVFSGCILATGLIVASAITGDFTSWHVSLRLTLSSLVRGLLGLVLAAVLTGVLTRQSRGAFAQRVRFNSDSGSALLAAVLLIFTAGLVRVVLAG